VIMLSDCAAGAECTAFRHLNATRVAEYGFAALLSDMPQRPDDGAWRSCGNVRAAPEMTEIKGKSIGAFDVAKFTSSADPTLLQTENVFASQTLHTEYFVLSGTALPLASLTAAMSSPSTKPTKPAEANATTLRLTRPCGVLVVIRFVDDEPLVHVNLIGPTFCAKEIAGVGVVLVDDALGVRVKRSLAAHAAAETAKEKVLGPGAGTLQTT